MMRMKAVDCLNLNHGEFISVFCSLLPPLRPARLQSPHSHRALDIHISRKFTWPIITLRFGLLTGDKNIPNQVIR